ncbi:efflux RND transporter periplasmic adaptor subunit [Imbroritus primus]|uniref:Efflux RND transporter periplasmic adaptor subunit n=1 Tax=Imbroritus primus TaxID=3058603 RepID=A0ACD3SL76_9BURK|nr:efflux RND transporter periplasmic adaptor subunit [Burkholderiaceae bacterium PBA]
MVEGKGRHRVWTAIGALLLAGAGWWLYQTFFAGGKSAREPAAVAVTIAEAQRKDVRIELTANGTVTALSTVEVRPQISSVVREVHVREGQMVKPGDLLFTLDTRMDEANLAQARATLAQNQADLADARRQLARSEDLLKRNFISASAVDTARAKVANLEGLISANRASIEANRVSVSYGTLRATIAGRTGAVTAFPGSLVQPGGAALLTIAQIDPVAVSFTLPERELAALQQALRSGPVDVSAVPNDGLPDTIQGKVTFVDNTVNPQLGTLLLKAQFDNAQQRLWPGTYVNIHISVRTLRDVIVVPPHAVLTGPDNRLVYSVDKDHKVHANKVKLVAVTPEAAVVEGIQPGTRVVVEGAQNLRPGMTVRESPMQPASTPAANGAQGEGGA